MVYCTPATLASLGLTDKATTREVERALYEAISLHDSRALQLGQCLRTLAKPQKAHLVRTFVVTFALGASSRIARKNLERYVKRLAGVLRKMKNLSVLSCWLGENTEMSYVEEVIREKHFNLRRLYISGLKDLGSLMQCQPQLEVIGLWFQEDILVYERATKHLRWSLAQHRLSGPDWGSSLDKSSCREYKARPVVIGMAYHYDGWYDETMRAITVFDYPMGHDSPADSFRIGGRCSDEPHFFEIPARNYEAFRDVQDDLEIGFARRVVDDHPGRTNLLRLVLPDLSSTSIEWALQVLLLTLKYKTHPYSPDAFVHFSIIEPPLPPFNLPPSAREPFKRLIATLFEYKINDIAFLNFFERDDNPRQGYYLDHDDSEEIAGPIGDLIIEAIGPQLTDEVMGKFDFWVFEEPSLPRDHEFFGV